MDWYSQACKQVLKIINIKTINEAKISSNLSTEELVQIICSNNSLQILSEVITYSHRLKQTYFNNKIFQLVPLYVTIYCYGDCK